MKELSIEEKAKRYDEIIEKANKMHCENCEACQMCIEELIPELAESEDERIIKAIKSAVLQLTDIYLQEKYGLKQSDCIAWLEKQGEQPQGKSALEAAKEEKVDNQNCVKPNDKVEPKFKVGDEIKTANEESLTITKIDEKGYWSKDLFICSFDEECIWDLAEPKPQWKPSDEQMDALDDVIDEYDGYPEFDSLVSLKNDLKKLREK